jgi:hypothetical protein
VTKILYVYEHELELDVGFELLKLERLERYAFVGQRCGSPSGRALFASLRDEPAIRCFNCGLKASVWIVDRSANEQYPNRQQGVINRRMNLFGRNAEGELVMMTQDHIIPVSKGGFTVLENLRPACERCNSRRGNTMNANDLKFMKQHPHLHLHGKVKKGKKRHAPRHEQAPDGTGAPTLAREVPCNPSHEVQLAA